MRSEDTPAMIRELLVEFANAIYSFPQEISDDKKMRTISDDPMNHFSNFIDINNAVQLRQNNIHESLIDDSLLRCKAFFRPAPSLHITAGGEIGICPLMNSGEKYGNIHKRDLLDIINGLQDSFMFRLHAQDEIRQYRKFVDKELFGTRFDHVCSLRTIINLIARRMHERNVDHQDLFAIREINLEVAKITGHMQKNKKMLASYF